MRVIYLELYNNQLNSISALTCSLELSAREYFDAYEHMLKRLKEFRPEFILMSAGFDSHIEEISSSEILEMIKNETITGGMIPKIKTCLDAINNGVNKHS